jgi:dihydroflavonol-4-reductase
MEMKNGDNMNTAMVFGASGFIGSHVVEQLLLAGIAVTAAVRAQSNTTFLRSTSATITTLDFTDDTALVNAIKGHDVVYNCMAEPRIHQSLANMRKVEIDLTRKVVQAAAAAGVKRFVQLSTIQVYGFSRPPVAINETYSINPIYTFSQVTAEREQMVIAECQRLQMDYVMVRPVNAIGQRDQQFLPIIKAHQQGVFLIVGDNPRFSCIDVRDIGRAMVMLGKLPQAANQTYLVKGYDTSWRELKQALDKKTGKAAKEIHLPKKLAHFFGWLGDQLPFRFDVSFTRFSVAVISTDTLFDDSKIRAAGFTPRYSLDEGLAGYFD